MSSYVTSGIDGEPWIFVYPHVATSALPPRYASQHSTRRGKYETRKEETHIHAQKKQRTYTCACVS